LSEIVLERRAQRNEREADDFAGVRGSVLIIGFGRFGQIVSQCLLAEGVDVTAIDNDGEMIESATRFGFKVYYGDGARLDVLRAAGAGNARLIAVCVDKVDVANRIVDLLRSEFAGCKLYARSYDRRHTLALIAKGVDFELRETFESALLFGRKTLEALGLDPERAGAIEEFIRTRDLDRLALQQVENTQAARDLLRTRLVQPEPLSAPRREAVLLNPEAKVADKEPASP
jgi:glutathione-regulated potassium-efflux system protein KefB